VPAAAVLGSPWVRPEVASQLIREYIYLYGAVCPADGACAFLILPSADTECFQIFLDSLAKKFSRWHILLIVDGAGNHKGGELVIPAKVTLARLPAYSPELNPQENIWDEIREKIFKNYAAKSMDEVSDKLVDGARYIESNPELRSLAWEWSHGNNFYGAFQFRGAREAKSARQCSDP